MKDYGKGGDEMKSAHGGTGKMASLNVWVNAIAVCIFKAVRFLVRII